ncbi:hypothetical protein GCM10009077_17130 [Roseibium denhamense]
MGLSGTGIALDQQAGRQQLFKIEHCALPACQIPDVYLNRHGVAPRGPDRALFLFVFLDVLRHSEGAVRSQHDSGLYAKAAAGESPVFPDIHGQ